MNLKEYVKELNKFLNDNPDMAKLPVVTATDGEVFHCSLEVYAPEAGYFNERLDSITFPKQEDFEKNDYEINAICIN